MDTKSTFETEQYNLSLSQINNIDDALFQITNQSKQQYSKEEIEIARGNLALMNDRVFALE